MGNTALHQPHLGLYHGARVPLHFGNPAEEFMSLRESCGSFRLTWRTKIAVTGKDRVRWLHNMVTNSVRDLPVNRGNYNFVLNAQGRILGDMYIYNRGESLVLDTDSSQVESLLSTMKRFIIMDKVEMNVAPIVAFGICGPKAEGLIPGTTVAAGADARGLEPLEIREIGEGRLLVRGPANNPGWYEVWLPVSDETGIALLGGWAGATMIGTQALEWWRIVHGIPHYGQDIRDRDLPQETEQAQALSFNKGCYIGQEIVERIRARGQVHRKFTGFDFGNALPALGKYESEGRAIAEITSVAAVPMSAGIKNIGLGYVRRELLAAGPEVDLNGHKARIADLPFAI